MPVQPSKDLLNDSLKETVFIRNNQPLFRQLAKETHFNLNEVEGLYRKNIFSQFLSFLFILYFLYLFLYIYFIFILYSYEYIFFQHSV